MTGDAAKPAKGTPVHLAAVDAGLQTVGCRGVRAAAVQTGKPHLGCCSRPDAPRISHMPALWPDRRRPHHCTVPDECRADLGRHGAPSQRAVCLHGKIPLHYQRISESYLYCLAC